jgi:hypothetical protein
MHDDTILGLRIQVKSKVTEGRLVLTIVHPGRICIWSGYTGILIMNRTEAEVGRRSHW